MSRRAPLFNVQSLSTQDGPGLRTAVFLQGCPLRCTWCSNPEGQEARPQVQWHAERCQGCGACVAACTLGAMRLDGVAGRPRFERSACRECAGWDCVGACPQGALQRVGRTWEAEELTALLKKDARLYRNSGGGVTFTGGEPLVHGEFVGVVARALHAASIHVAVETCGLWDWEEVGECLRQCDLIFFDVKCLDGEVHRRFTGSSNERILENLRRLAEARAGDVIVSIPVVPGVVDTVEGIEEVGAFVSGLGIGHVRLLGYHNWGRGKYAALGREYPHEAWEAVIGPQVLRAGAQRLERQGLTVGEQ